MNIAHYCPLLPDQTVEQCALAHIRLAYYGNRNASFYCLSRGKRVHHSYYVTVYLHGKLPQLASVGKLKLLVVAEIEFELKE